MEKLYVSDMNYYPGKKDLKAGTVFSVEQWEDAGGTEENLKIHVKRGYIREAVQEVPETLVADEPKAVKEQKAPEGIWTFDIEQLENLSLNVLNTMYKQRAAEFNQEVSPYEDKEALILKMCSEKD